MLDGRTHWESMTDETKRSDAMGLGDGQRQTLSWSPTPACCRVWTPRGLCCRSRTAWFKGWGFVQWCCLDAYPHAAVMLSLLADSLDWLPSGWVPCRLRCGWWHCPVAHATPCRCCPPHACPNLAH